MVLLPRGSNGKNGAQSELEDQIVRRLPSPFDEIVYCHMQVVLAVQAAQWPDAFERQGALCAIVVTLTGRWSLPVVYAAAQDVRELGRKVRRRI